jgi:hypothetical protein
MPQPPEDDSLSGGDDNLGCDWTGVPPEEWWCARHSQLAPELRQLAGLQPCVARLPLPDRLRTVMDMSPDRLEWATTDQEVAVRAIAALRMPVDQLEWAAQDPSELVRAIAAERDPNHEHGPGRPCVAHLSLADRVRATMLMSPDQLEWSKSDESELVRAWAAARANDYGFARTSHDPWIRAIATERDLDSEHQPRLEAEIVETLLQLHP